ncbi:MAG: molybdate ABC transporter substrate-binding protein [Fibrobacterota bacterium]|nr:MAG: molybdate ABC transporter substrate-binding protein [Fibrobacterota bacterium]
MHRTSICLLLWGFVFQAGAQITVAAAANVKPALEEIKSSFEKVTGSSVKVVYGASGKFASQIRSGAPFDVFVAADVSFPDSVVAWKLAEGKPVVYALGTVVLWTSIADLDPSKGPVILRDPRVRKIGVADPKVAPYGREAMKAIEASGAAAEIKPKIVWGENLAQATQYAVTGAVEAAFSGKSYAMELFAGKGKWADVDPSLVAPIPQAAVVLKYGKVNNPKLSQSFVAYLSSPAAQASWKKFGYKLP